MRRVYEKLIKEERARLPRSDPEGFAAVCRRNDFAYMALPESLGAMMPALPCALAEVRGAGVPENMAFALRKDSPYRHIFNLKYVLTLTIVRKRT